MNILIIMGILPFLEVSSALKMGFNIPWLRNVKENSPRLRSISSDSSTLFPRNSNMRSFVLSEDIDRPDYDEYGNVLMHLERSGRDLTEEYKNLCETVTRKREIQDPLFEYQPPHYYEIFCKSHDPANKSERIQQKCANPVFDCVQRSRTLFMLRRRWNKDCWEPVTIEIASGCNCMWPVSTLGDISKHFE